MTYWHDWRLTEFLGGQQAREILCFMPPLWNKMTLRNSFPNKKPTLVQSRFFIFWALSHTPLRQLLFQVGLLPLSRSYHLSYVQINADMWEIQFITGWCRRKAPAELCTVCNKSAERAHCCFQQRMYRLLAVCSHFHLWPHLTIRWPSQSCMTSPSGTAPVFACQRHNGCCFSTENTSTSILSHGLLIKESEAF